MSRSELIVACSIGTALLGGCASPEPPRTVSRAGAPITLTDSDSGRTLAIDPGQRVVIRLAINLTTGYTWTLAKATDDAVLKNLGAVYAPSGTGAAGSGGTQSWSFEAVGAGEQALHFAYSRPWERDTPASKTLSYTITVR